jgi:hypothetical protein
MRAPTPPAATALGVPRPVYRHGMTLAELDQFANVTADVRTRAGDPGGGDADAIEASARKVDGVLGPELTGESLGESESQALVGTGTTAILLMLDLVQDASLASSAHGERADKQGESGALGLRRA